MAEERSPWSVGHGAVLYVQKNTGHTFSECGTWWRVGIIQNVRRNERPWEFGVLEPPQTIHTVWNFKPLRTTDKTRPKIRQAGVKKKGMYTHMLWCSNFFNQKRDFNTQRSGGQKSGAAVKSTLQSVIVAVKRVGGLRRVAFSSAFSVVSAL